MSDLNMASIIGTPILKCNRQTDVYRHQNTDMGTFGLRLKKCRISAGLKQKEVCARTGIKQGTLSELENDKYPTSSFVPHLASLYGVEALWLAEGRGPKVRGDSSPRDEYPRISDDDDRVIKALASMTPERAAYWRERVISEARLAELKKRIDAPPEEVLDPNQETSGLSRSQGARRQGTK